ncbi:hypothetical protein SLEP1_g4671 [Rubroshorea leprosula]|uniref:Uncharacterized protein n=1 Tax=Rubroshorea leprosula TaxID=152421 RepID=A0AAV5HPG7_9ROSI|nr:hypothetical protein SLEP1_g4671 [Rubroshorea leprosula]
MEEVEAEAEAELEAETKVEPEPESKVGSRSEVMRGDFRGSCLKLF